MIQIKFTSEINFKLCFINNIKNNISININQRLKCSNTKNMNKIIFKSRDRIR
jgi:hypothetical protein